jgi:hypothetical protein
LICLSGGSIVTLTYHAALPTNGAARSAAVLNTLYTDIQSWSTGVDTSLSVLAGATALATPNKVALRDAAAGAAFGSLTAVAFNPTTISGVFRGAAAQAAKIFTVQTSGIVDCLFVDGNGNPGSQGTWTHTGALSASGKVTATGGAQLGALGAATIGYVWTATDVNGNGSWQASAGGSGGSGGAPTSAAYAIDGAVPGALPNAFDLNAVGAAKIGAGSAAGTGRLLDFWRKQTLPDVAAASRFTVSGASATYFASVAQPMTIAIGGKIRTITASPAAATAPSTGGAPGVMALVVDADVALPFLTIQATPVNLSATQMVVQRVAWDGASMYLNAAGFQFGSAEDPASIYSNQVKALVVQGGTAAASSFTNTTSAPDTAFPGINFAIAATANLMVTHRCRAQLVGTAAAGTGYIEGYVYIINQANGVVVNPIYDTNVGMMSPLGAGLPWQGWMNTVGWYFNLPAGRYTLSQYWVVANATASLFSRSISAEIKGY